MLHHTVVPPLGGGEGEEKKPEGEEEKKPPEGGTTNVETSEWAPVVKLLTEDAKLLKKLFATAAENLPQLKGKTVRIGGMAMKVSEVKGGKVYVRQDEAEMAWDMEKLGDETTLMLALLGDKDPKSIARQKALYAFYYGRANEVAAKLNDATEAGADVAFYVSRLTPVLAVSTSPPGAEITLRKMVDGTWSSVDDEARTSPAKIEVEKNTSYSVEIGKAGFATVWREVRTGEGGEHRVSVRLKKQLLPSGLVLYYSFDKPGDRAEDKSGKGNHGTLHGVKWTADGKVGGAYEFDGRDDFVQTPHSEDIDFGPGNLTIAAWIYATAWSARDGLCAIAHKGWSFRVATGRHTGGVPKLNFETGRARRYYSNHQIDLKRWHHVAIARKSPAQYTFYVDGREDGKFNDPLEIAYKVPLSISGQVDYRGEPATFAGLIDEFMIFNRALSEAEIQAVMNARSLAPPAKPSEYLAPKDLLADDFEVPKATKDKHGNSIRKGTDKATGLPLEIRHKKTGMHLVFIPAGEFMMGSPEDEQGRMAHEGPQRRVRMVNSFYLGKYEVTQAEWAAVMGDNPSQLKGNENPVEQVSWRDCKEFSERLNRGRPQAIFYLPTEAQWEYACRAGAGTCFYFGNGPDHRGLGEHGWYRQNSGRTHPVGQKAPNPLGLYDMIGNVWEICRDVWHDDYRGLPVDGSAWLDGGDQVAHPLRGGSMNESWDYQRSASRHHFANVRTAFNVGLRVALIIPVGEPQGPPVREGLVLYYPFDKAGDRAEDKSGKGNHGKVHQAKWTPNGKLGGAYEFDGKTTYIQRDYDERSGLYPRDTAFSVAVWLKASAPPPRVPAILGTHCAGLGSGYYLTLFAEERAGRAVWCASWPANVTSKLPVNDGKWHHAVGVWDASKNFLYIDGSLQGSCNAPAPISYHHAPFRIGHLQSAPNARAGDYYFKGTIDEVMVFNRALSQDEIKLLATPERWGAVQQLREADPPAGKAIKGGQEPEAARGEAPREPEAEEAGPGAAAEAAADKETAASEWAASEDGLLSIRLRSPQKSYPRGEPFILVAQLRNDSKESVTIQKLFDDDYAARAGEVDIVGPKGRVKYVGENLDQDPPFRTVNLQPGKTVEAQIKLRLDDHDSVDVPGAYQVTYAYRSAQWRGKEEERPAHWSGTIKTKALEIVRTKFRLLWRESSGIPIEKVPTPEGLKVSPAQVIEPIMARSRRAPWAEFYLFADTRNYYLGIARRGTKLTGPEPGHWVIDGTTGKTVHAKAEGEEGAGPGDGAEDGAAAEPKVLSEVDVRKLAASFANEQLKGKTFGDAKRPAPQIKPEHWRAVEKKDGRWRLAIFPPKGFNFVVTMNLDGSKPVLEAQTGPPSQVERFQAQWPKIKTPKLLNSREYWDKRVADAGNLAATEHPAGTITQELTQLAPNVLKQLTLYGSLDAVRQADICAKVVVRGEREGGLPQIVGYLDAKSGKMLMVLFYNEG